jgi:hypothetical protein
MERDRAVHAEEKTRQERDRALGAEKLAEGAVNRATVERLRTAEAADTVKALNDFLRDDLLTVADPRKQFVPGQADMKPNPDLTVREALDRAAARIAGRFDTQPLVEAALRETIAATYTSLGLNTLAQPQLERAVELRKKVGYEERADTMKAMEKRAVLNRPLDIDEKSFYAYEALKTAKNGNWKESEELYTQLLKIERQPASGSQEQQLLFTISLLGWTQIHQQKYIEAEKILREALAFEKTKPEDWNRYNAMGGLGASLEGQKKYVEAEPLLLSAYDGITAKQCGVGDINRWDMIDCALFEEESGTRIVRLYKDWEKPGKAAQWEEKLRMAKAPVVPQNPKP